MVMNAEGNIVIGGAGPSLTCIDYSRLPKSFDTFRLNNFFFEKKYYLGKRITHYFTDYGFLKRQFFNLWNLSERGEYSVENFFSNGNLDEYPTVNNLETIIFREEKFAEFIFFYKTYYGCLVSGGIFSLFGSIAMGYKNIYLTGIDFYKDSKNIYPWELGEKYRGANPRDDSEEKALKVINHYHPEDVQVKALLLAKDVLMRRGGNIYSISPDSKVNDYVEMAPIRNGSEMHVMDKREDAMLDWMDLPEIKEFVQTSACSEPASAPVCGESVRDEQVEIQKLHLGQSIDAIRVGLTMLKNRPSFFELYRVRLLKHITFGRIKNHYTEKYNKYKNIVQYIENNI